MTIRKARARQQTKATAKPILSIAPDDKVVLDERGLLRMKAVLRWGFG
jgi:hypothetical protein